jgi:hypothetical protein
MDIRPSQQLKNGDGRLSKDGETSTENVMCMRGLQSQLHGGPHDAVTALLSASSRVAFAVFAFPATADYNIGPVSARETEASRAALQESVQGTLEATFASMLRERKDRQRAIDSAGEFMRLSHVCGEGGAGVKPELRR